VVGHFKSPGRSNFFLALLDGRITEFFDPTTADTDDMVVMFSLIQFKYGLITFKVVSLDQTCRFKLGQNPVDSREAYFGPFLNQAAMQFFCSQVPLVVGTAFEQLKNLDSRCSDLEPCLLDISIVHRIDPEHENEGGRHSSTGKPYWGTSRLPAIAEYDSSR